MNSKLIKYAAVGAVALIFLFSMLYFLSDRNEGSSTPVLRQPTSNELEQLSGTAQNFVVLYNSYAYQNFDDIRSLYSSQNLTMQAQLDTYLQDLARTVPAGYRQDTEVVPNTFQYEFTEANTAQAQLQLKVTVYRGNQRSQSQATAYLTLVRDYDAWSVNNIRIVKMWYN